MFSVYIKTPNSVSLKHICEKLHFHDRLVWTVGLTIEIRLHFQIALNLDRALVVVTAAKKLCRSMV